jgi:hypothetical protein
MPCGALRGHVADLNHAPGQDVREKRMPCGALRGATLILGIDRREVVRRNRMPFGALRGQDPNSMEVYVLSVRGNRMPCGALRALHQQVRRAPVVACQRKTNALRALGGPSFCRRPATFVISQKKAMHHARLIRQGENECPVGHYE